MDGNDQVEGSDNEDVCGAGHREDREEQAENANEDSSTSDAGNNSTEQVSISMQS